jgi:hypothetical protein
MRPKDYNIFKNQRNQHAFEHFVFWFVGRQPWGKVISLRRLCKNRSRLFVQHFFYFIFDSELAIRLYTGWFLTAPRNVKPLFSLNIRSQPPCKTWQQWNYMPPLLDQVTSAKTIWAMSFMHDMVVRSFYPQTNGVLTVFLPTLKDGFLASAVSWSTLAIRRAEVYKLLSTSGVSFWRLAWLLVTSPLPLPLLPREIRTHLNVAVRLLLNSKGLVGPVRVRGYMQVLQW